MGKVGVHDENEVASSELQTMQVGGSKAKLTRTRLEDLRKQNAEKLGFCRKVILRIADFDISSKWS